MDFAGKFGMIGSSEELVRMQAMIGDDIEDGLVFISSCQPKPGCMEAVKAGLKKYGHFKECWETDIGTTIGGYSGPGTIGIVFARKEK